MADKIAVLTGGAGKMGGGICRALAEEGITSAVLDLDVSRAENAANVRQLARRAWSAALPTGLPTPRST